MQQVLLVGIEDVKGNDIEMQMSGDNEENLGYMS
jgi:hypothetical protein